MQSRNQIVLFVLFWVALGSAIFVLVPADSLLLSPDKSKVSQREEAPATIRPVKPESAAIRSMKEQAVPVVRVDEPTRVVGELRGSDVYVVNAVMLTVRSKPNRYSPRVRFLKQGDRVVKLGQEGRWFKIGHNEYISSTYLDPLQPTMTH